MPDNIAALDDYRALQAQEAAERKPKHSDRLIAIAQRAHLFHTSERTAYADVRVNGHRETWPVGSKVFREWLTHEFFKEESTAPSRKVMDEALGVIEARARFESPEREAHLRVARVDDKIYLDLCDDAWRAVEVDKSGWRVVSEPEARFRRAPGMLALPAPEPGGDIDELRPFLNLPQKTQGREMSEFVLTVAWLLGALSGRGPYPVIVIAGQHGAAKTFFGRVLRALIDPNKVDLRALPRHDHDLYVAGGNAHVLAFDNISTVPNWLSDTLCRISTGGGFATRRLYTDADEKLFDGMRPLMLNGIEDFVTRPDLDDRTIALVLEDIPDDKRCPEAELWADFEKVRPRVLGALLDAASHGLSEIATTRLKELPRMADFALWVVACEVWTPKVFIDAYTENRRSGQIALLDAHAVATAVLNFATALEPQDDKPLWEGKAAALLDELGRRVTDEVRRDREQWPKTARGLSGKLRRITKPLKEAGVVVGFGKKNTIFINRTTVTASAGGRENAPET